jgi:UDP-N-acetylmuramoyl-tripeptide--D-alanyl-D-alanine ligase
MEHKDGLRAITYGSDESAAFTGNIIETQDTQLKVQVSFKSCTMSIETKLFGRYNFENVLAAACIGCHFNVPPDKIKAGIEQYVPANNRSQVVNTGKNILIMDAYNANPDSMKSAILNFKASSYPEKTLIIGDMLELGKESDEEHGNILKLIEESGFTDVFLVGPVFTRLNTQRDWLCFQDSDLAKLWFEHHPMQGRTILIKGSRGILMEKITDTIKNFL